MDSFQILRQLCSRCCTKVWYFIQTCWNTIPNRSYDCQMHQFISVGYLVLSCAINSNSLYVNPSKIALIGCMSICWLCFIIIILRTDWLKDTLDSFNSLQCSAHYVSLAFVSLKYSCWTVYCQCYFYSNTIAGDSKCQC